MPKLIHANVHHRYHPFNLSKSFENWSLSFSLTSSFQSPPHKRHDYDNDDQDHHDSNRRIAMNDNHQRHDTNDNHHNTKNNGLDNSFRRRTPSPRRADDNNDDQKSPSPTPRQPPQRVSSSTRVRRDFVHLIGLTNIFIDVYACLCTGNFFVCAYMLLYSLTKKTRIRLRLLYNLMFVVILHVNRLFDKNNSQRIS